MIDAHATRGTPTSDPFPLSHTLSLPFSLSLFCCSLDSALLFAGAPEVDPSSLICPFTCLLLLVARSLAPSRMPALACRSISRAALACRLLLAGMTEGDISHLSFVGSRLSALEVRSVVCARTVWPELCAWPTLLRSSQRPSLFRSLTEVMFLPVPSLHVTLRKNIMAGLVRYCPVYAPLILKETDAGFQPGFHPSERKILEREDVVGFFCYFIKSSNFFLSI